MADRAITYARVSTAVQAEGSSLDTQVEACREYAESRGWEVAGEYRDDLSGTTPLDQRPGLYAAYMLCIADGVAAMVVHDVDRLARKALEREVILDAFDTLEVRIEFVLGGSTATSSDKMVVGFKGVIADAERLNILERTTRGKLSRVKSGMPLVFNRPPFGYTAETDRDEKNRVINARLVVVDEQAKTVRRIFSEFAAGANMQAIATGLSEDRVSSYADGHANVDKRSNERGIWGRTSVLNILRNETYAGRWHYGKTRVVKIPGGGKRREPRPRNEWIQVPVPPIVDQDTWMRAQARLADNHKPRRQPKVPHPLQGRVFCSNCGRRLSRQVSRRKLKAYVYWRCNGSRGRVGHPNRTCAAGPVNGRVLESAVRDWVARLAYNPGNIQDQYYQELTAAEPLVAELETVSERIEKEQRALERFGELYAYGDISKKGLAGKRKKIQAEIARQQARREELEDLVGTPPDEDALREIAHVLEEFALYLRGVIDDPAIPVGLVLDAYAELALAVRVDAMDPDNLSAVLTSHLGSESVLL